MGPTWVLSAPDGPHAGPMDIALRYPISERKFYTKEFHGSKFNPIFWKGSPVVKASQGVE